MTTSPSSKPATWPKMKQPGSNSSVNKKHEMTCIILYSLFGLVCWTNIVIVSLDLYVGQTML
jgi:uncharacterized membrane protein YhdT